MPCEDADMPCEDADMPCQDADMPCEDGSYDYPCAPDAQHQEGAIEMIENPAYDASSDYIMYY